VQLEEIAEELYGLLPEDFTAERDRRAGQLRAAGDREQAAAVKALRRPAVPAWLVNALVRHRAEDVEQVLALGESLRAAQAGLDAARLRELGRRRQDLLGVLRRQARDLAVELGRPVGATVLEEVEATLQAAVADQAAAEAVRTGRLTAPLSYAGFGEVDLTDAVAVPVLRRLSAVRDLSAERRRAAAVKRAQAARRTLDAAQTRVEELEAELAAARAEAEAAHAAWAPLQAEAEADA
jgi:hypothetical protein